jgi:DNA-binding response OmpR family regulator
MFSNVLEEPECKSTDSDDTGSILIVDDDDALAEVLSRRLRQQGFRTLTADSGAIGLTLARLEHPLLVLLDLGLPDTDGFTVCQQLVDSSETCDIPVIILSGMDDPDIVRRSRAAGCRYFLGKPYDPGALLVLIRQTIADCANWETDAA